MQEIDNIKTTLSTMQRYFMLWVAAGVALVFVQVRISVADTLKIYWSDGAIRRSNLDGTEVEQIIQSPWGEKPKVAFDPAEQKMYWSSTTAGGIQRSNYDGTDIELAISGIAAPAHATVDTLNRKVYWSDTTSPSIWRSDLDGTNRELLQSAIPTPLALEIDPVRGYYYWSNFGGEIHRGSFFGSDISTVHFGNWPGSLAIDGINNYLYASDFSTNAVLRMRLDLSDPTVWVTQGVSYPSGIVVDSVNERVIWTNTQLTPFGRNISSIAFDGTGQKIDFYPLSSGNYPLSFSNYLAIVEISNPEPSSAILISVGGVLISFCFRRHRLRESTNLASTRFSIWQFL